MYDADTIANTTAVLDIIFIIIIFVCTVDGYRQGFVKSLLGLIISVLAPVIAYFSTRSLWEKMSDAVTPATSDRGEFFTAFISFIVILLVIITVAQIILKTAGFINKVPVVGVLNKVLGIVFGLAGAVVIILVLAAIYETYGLYTGQIEPGELVATDYSKVLTFIFDTI
jgi:uncharacterized membrane protein required for colicin V production